MVCGEGEGRRYKVYICGEGGGFSLIVRLCKVPQMCHIDFDVLFKAAIPAFQLPLEVIVWTHLLIGKQKHLENFLKSCHGGIGMHSYTLYIVRLGGTCTLHNLRHQTF